jgi:hypothetical protein
MEQEITIGKLRQAFDLTPEQGRCLLKTIGGKLYFDGNFHDYKVGPDNFKGEVYVPRDENYKEKRTMILVDSDEDENFIRHSTNIDPKYSRTITGNTVTNWDHANDTIMEIVRGFQRRKKFNIHRYQGVRKNIFEDTNGEYPRDVQQILSEINKRPQDEEYYLYEALLDLCRVDKRSAILKLSEDGTTFKRETDGLTYAIYMQLYEQVPSEIVQQYSIKISELMNNKKTGNVKKLKAILLQAQGLSYKDIAKNLNLTWNSKNSDSNIRNKYVNAGKNLAVEFGLPDLSRWLPGSTVNPPGDNGPPQK